MGGMKLLYNILILLSFLQSVIGFTLMSSTTMRFREPVKKRVLIGIAMMLCGIILLCYQLFTKGLYSVDRFAILVILVIELTWFILCSKDHFFVSLFSFLTFVNIYISTGYLGDLLSINIKGNTAVLMIIIFRSFIYMLELPLLYKFVRSRFRRLVDALDREWRVAVIVPLMFLIIQIMVLYYPSPYWRWEKNTWPRIIIVTVYLLFLAVYYLLYIQASAIVEKYSLEKRQLLMMQQEKLWESELARQKATTALLYQQRHDMRHHNALIMELLQQGDIDQLNAYMKNFEEALNHQIGKSFSTNPIANSLFNLYARRAETHGIKMIFHVSLPEAIGIDSIDLTCILGNALENAIEGCLRISEEKEKEIIVSSKFIDHRLRIQIENTCLNDIIFDGEFPVTQKRGGGTGVKSILYTAERYDGTAGFAVKNGKFITQIVLNAR